MILLMKIFFFCLRKWSGTSYEVFSALKKIFSKLNQLVQDTRQKLRLFWIPFGSRDLRIIFYPNLVDISLISECSELNDRRFSICT